MWKTSENFRWQEFQCEGRVQLFWETKNGGYVNRSITPQ